MRPFVFATATIVIFVASLASAEDYSRTHPEEHGKVLEILEGSNTRRQLERILGNAPTRCIASVPGLKSCAWELSKQQSGWQPLSHALSTHRRVTVICDLPDDGSERARSACFAVPMESNRWKFRTTARKSTKNRKLQKDAANKRDEREVASRQMLADATTFFELVRLVGALPDYCQSHSETERRCLWKASARTYGHGTLAASIGAAMSKRVRLTCTLPKAAGLRAPDSCEVTIGR